MAPATRIVVFGCSTKSVPPLSLFIPAFSPSNLSAYKPTHQTILSRSFYSLSASHHASRKTLLPQTPSAAAKWPKTPFSLQHPPPASKSQFCSTQSSSPPPPVPPPLSKATSRLSSILSSIRQFGARPKDSKVSFRKLIPLAKPESRTIALAIIFLFISSWIGMTGPYVVGQLMNFFTQEKSDDPEKPNLTFIGLALVPTLGCLTLLYIAGAGAGLTRTYLMKTSGQRIIARIRNRSYQSVLEQEVEYSDRHAGDIVTRLSNDSTILGESITTNTSDALRALSALICCVGAMLYVNASVTAVVLAIVPPTAIGSIFYGRYIQKLATQQQEALGSMSKTAEEKLGSVRTIKAYGNHVLEAETFAGKVDKVFEIAKREIKANAIYQGFASRLMGDFIDFAVIVYGGIQVQQGVLSIGDLTALLIYTNYVDGSIQALAGCWTSLSRGLGAGERVFDLLEKKPQIKSDDGQILGPDEKGDIEFKNVNFTYPSRPDQTILKGIDVRIRKGESVAIVGPSGSGKSSIQSLLMRFYEPDHGQILFNGTPISTYSLNSWRQSIGLVSQQPVIFAGTIHDNIAYGKPGGKATREEVEEAARLAGCQDFIEDLDQEYETVIGRTSLSGGQAQRLNIARALIRKPRILLLDESTSALDTASERHVNEAIDKIMDGKETTVILVAHRLSSIAQADRVILVDNGVVAEDGPFDELAADPNSKFAALVSSQLAHAPLDSEEPVSRAPEQPMVAPTHSA